MTIYKVNVIKDIVYSSILATGIETVVYTMIRKPSKERFFSTREKANEYLQALKNEPYKRENYEDIPHYQFTAKEYEILTSAIVNAGYSYKKTFRRTFDGEVESITIE